jgi:plastocyanin
VSGARTSFVALAAAITLTGCRDSVSPSDDEGNEPAAIVTTVGATFVPPFVTIAVGETVRFDIGGNEEGHDVTFLPGRTGTPANIPVTFEGKVDRTFTTVGVFPYDCKVHPGMAGEIEVK